MSASTAPAAPNAPTKAQLAQADTLLTVKHREPAYRVTDGAPRVEMTPGVFVTRGVRVNGDTPSLVVVDGSRQTGIPLSAVAHAILGNVITDAEIHALQAQRAA